MTAAPRRLLSRWAVLGCVLALVLSAGLWWVSAATGTRITAYFDKTVGLYPGSSVRVLGVEVGKIDEVLPRGGVVQVGMTVPDDVRLPAGAKAVVVAPSLVSDRYVQLTPAYTGGPRLASGAVIPKEHTVTPAELDDLYRNANTLSEALGPNGANERGELNGVLNTAAANLRGNGEDLNTTMRRLADLSATLSDSRGDLFATVDNLNEFTATLARSDEQIRELYGRTANVTGVLDRDRDQLGTALHSLAGALGDVQGFVRDNRALLSSNVHNLAGATRTLVDQRKAVAEVLDVAPTGATNFINAYDAASGSVAVRGQLNELTLPPVLMVCKLVEAGVPRPIPPELTKTCSDLAPVLDDALKVPSVAEALARLQSGQPWKPPPPTRGGGG